MVYMYRLNVAKDVGVQQEGRRNRSACREPAYRVWGSRNHLTSGLEIDPPKRSEWTVSALLFSQAEKAL